MWFGRMGVATRGRCMLLLAAAASGGCGKADRGPDAVAECAALGDGGAAPAPECEPSPDVTEPVFQDLGELDPVRGDSQRSARARSGSSPGHSDGCRAVDGRGRASEPVRSTARRLGRPHELRRKRTAGGRTTLDALGRILATAGRSARCGCSPQRHRLGRQHGRRGRQQSLTLTVKEKIRAGPSRPSVGWGRSRPPSSLAWRTPRLRASAPMVRVGRWLQRVGLSSGQRVSLERALRRAAHCQDGYVLGKR